MADPSGERFDQEAKRLEALLPSGPRVGVFGSTEFWHPESERTCAEMGRLLASIVDLTLLTGGVEGIGEAVGRAFSGVRERAAQEHGVYHILPVGDEAWDYGETLFAGSDMTERREILGRLARVFLLVEGGPGAEHEAEVAASHGATVIPVGRSGGHAAVLYCQEACPPAIDGDTWAVLGESRSSPEVAALAAFRAVKAVLGIPG